LAGRSKISTRKSHHTGGLDILSISAHPDDTELVCGGTVIKMVDAGYRVGLLDLTAGESGTRGTPELRARESDHASKVMGIVHRENLGFPDAGLEHAREYKMKLAQRIRHLRPRTVILPYWEGRHPDHYTAGQIGYESCFLAGLEKLALKGAPYRPRKIIYASLYMPAIRPSFVVDITEQFERKLKAILCYRSQFSARSRSGSRYCHHAGEIDLGASAGALSPTHGILISNLKFRSSRQWDRRLFPLFVKK